MESQLRIFAGIEQLNQAAAELWLSLAQQAIAQRGSFHIALSGGSTPKLLYQRIATLANAELLQHSHFYFGDERCVPPDHPDSNYRMAREALFDRAAIPAANIHRIDAELPAAQAAQRYQALLQRQLPSVDGMGCFDLILLGMGEDGHTASLFPGTTALSEQHNWVCANEVPQLHTWRITFSYPLINHARHVAILSAGAGKAEVMRQVHQHSQQPPYPIENIRASHTLHWLLDHAAASRLEPQS
ncbi:MAG: 6-phosphogluconolactonase [Gammaproteobacteria bacterium]|nr:6-phosphogluconolactonase [Gammaproteobacteria bacterium]